VLEFDWENSVGHWLCSTSHVIRKELGAQLAKEGMTLRQVEVLAWLSCNGCGAQTELAEGVGIEPHTLAGVLNRMERDGLLERQPCSHDRRKKKIKPTAKAEDIWSRATRLCHGIRNRVVEGFSDEELALLRSMCERIRENLTAEPQVTPEAASHECRCEAGHQRRHDHASSEAAYS
jgi:MarR family transcriptional regulator for hemolysin